MDLTNEFEEFLEEKKPFGKTVYFCRKHLIKYLIASVWMLNTELHRNRPLSP